MASKREIHFHEDDYCQQQLLPAEVAEYAEAELRKINDFAEAHRAADGLGWTDVYGRKQAPLELPAFKIDRTELDPILTKFLPRFEVVYTGYGSHRELCHSTAAWGKSQQCALFADWNADGIVRNIWAEFFDREEESILSATGAVAAMGEHYRLVYVDWAWGYTCQANDAAAFALKSRSKLEAIANNLS